MAGLNPSYAPFANAAALHALAQAAASPVLIDRVDNPGEMVDEVNKIAQEDIQATQSDEVFSNYTHKEIIPGAQPHPADIVEAGSLAALSLPNPTYPVSQTIPKEVIQSCKLSSLQIEGILYACQRHQLMLPNGKRAGFFIGDGAGVGKGRQVAGVILDSFARGRTKHIWFSISADLIVDARRDLGDIGCYIKVIEGCQQLDKETRVFGLPAGFKEGVIFSTYATLVSAVQKGGAFNSGKQSRLQQLIDWCGGPNFDGCLIFDECHKAKNFVPGKEQASTKVALAVASIQRLLPRARVLYCSATGVTDVKNMAFMERLGLWGEGAPFKSFENFIETVQRKGLGVAEMLAMEMKTSGMYISRGLSFRQAEFMTQEIPLTEAQVKVYDTAAHVWNELRNALETALSRTYTSNNRIWASYWAAHQRFFKQLCMGMKVPAVVEEAKKALSDGYSVVIGLQTTGEASLESELSKSGCTLKGWVSLCREIYTRFIQQYFPTVIETKTATEAQEDEWSAAAKKMLLSFADKIELPNSPLDEIIDKLGGHSSVAEMTGRRGRMIRRSQNESPQYQLRDASDSGTGLDSLNVTERNHFMEGRKLVAIISDAASTGISLHADMRVANQRRRVHMTMELPWSADKAVQQLGRSHRSNQSSGPLYKLLTTNLGGERRFAAAVARRLQSLGALTKGDRRAATGADLAEFNFDTPYGRNALKIMYNAICQKGIAAGVSLSSLTEGKMDLAEFNSKMQECLKLMGVIEQDVLHTHPKVKDSDSRDVGKFLNRILGLGVSKQNMIFNYFCQCLTAQVLYAKKEGRYNEGLVDITASSVEMEGTPREVFKEAATQNNTTHHIMLRIDRGMSWDAAVTRLGHYKGERDGFYCSRREIRGKHLYILATQKEGSSHLFRVARPSTGLSIYEEEYTDITQKYYEVTPEKAKAGWTEQYEQSQKQCMHGSGCKNGPTCRVGSRTYKLHLLCGGIVTMMSLLESTVAKYATGLQITKAESTLRVVRVQLDNGERVVGVRYPEMLIPLVERALKEAKAVEFIIAQQKKQSTTEAAAGLTATASTSSDSCDTLHLLKCTTEEVTAVNQRCLNKALTPPVTLKNFFKPVTKSKSVDGLASGVDSQDLTNTSVAMEIQMTKSAPKDQFNGEKICADDRTEGEEPKDVVSDDDCEVVCESKHLSEKSDVRNSSQSDFLTKSVQSSIKKGGKRTGGKIQGPVAKKAKQSSIFASFTKQRSKLEEKKADEQRCPICQMLFEDGTSNSDINHHVDNCLIE